jgi:hypothetical protein
LEELHWATLDKTLEMLAHEAARLKRVRRGTHDITCLSLARVIECHLRSRSTLRRA